MNNDNNDNDIVKEQIIKYINDKIKKYDQFKKIMYDVIDQTHYPTSNIEVFKIISDLTIRQTELYDLVNGLTRNNNNNKATATGVCNSIK